MSTIPFWTPVKVEGCSVLNWTEELLAFGREEVYHIPSESGMISNSEIEVQFRERSNSVIGVVIKVALFVTIIIPLIAIIFRFIDRVCNRYLLTFEENYLSQPQPDTWPENRRSVHGDSSERPEEGVSSDFLMSSKIDNRTLQLINELTRTSKDLSLYSKLKILSSIEPCDVEPVMKYLKERGVSMDFSDNVFILKNIIDKENYPLIKHLLGQIAHQRYHRDNAPIEESLGRDLLMSAQNKKVDPEIIKEINKSFGIAEVSGE